METTEQYLIKNHLLEIEKQARLMQKQDKEFEQWRIENDQRNKVIMIRMVGVFVALTAIATAALMRTF